MAQIWQQFTHGVPEKPVVLELQGRKLEVHKSAKDNAFFTFSELCTTAMGAADYIAIASAFPTVFLADIPILHNSEFNWVRRLITLVDTLYEHKVKLICSAAAPPELIFVPDDAGGAGHEEKFAWSRTLSRLAEMQTQEYLSSPHKPSNWKN